MDINIWNSKSDQVQWKHRNDVTIFLYLVFCALFCINTVTCRLWIHPNEGTQKYWWASLSRARGGNSSLHRMQNGREEHKFSPSCLFNSLSTQPRITWGEPSALANNTLRIYSTEQKLPCVCVRVRACGRACVCTCADARASVMWAM